MNQLPEGGAPTQKKALPKGCFIALIVGGILLVLLVAGVALFYLYRGEILNWGIMQSTAQMERVLIQRAGPTYDSTRIQSLFEEYRQAGKEGRISVDSLRNISFYLSWVADTSKPLDTADVSHILANFKASILSAPDPRLKK
ncbi:MAG TPA: hypothetical protein VI546_04895 [candidate division Zixibacteria bacterium]|nr:hypothetical protein [candidate division Zixibacteria bacterium]